VLFSLEIVSFLVDLTYGTRYHGKVSLMKVLSGREHSVSVRRVLETTGVSAGYFIFAVVLRSKF
jgi:hypothetical protein